MNYHQEFYDWLDEIVLFMPPKMSVHECRLLYERKIKEEKEIENEKENKSS